MKIPEEPGFPRSGLSRRRFFRTAAGITAALGAGSVGMAHAGGRDDDEDHGLPHRRGATPAPRPIPGGTDLSGFGLSPPFDFIHIFAPGPSGIVLPFTGIPLEGLDVEPGVIGDFRGATALAYVIGEAAGSDGTTYGLEVDLRAMEGSYIAEDGSRQHGAFALL